MGRLAGRKALVTGAAQGIGAAIAMAFAHEGADVAIFDIARAQAVEVVLEAIRAAGRRALYCPVDVSNADQVCAGVAEVQNAFGPLDILVNNAGIVRQALVAEMAVEDWDRVLAVNLRGAFLCTRHVLPGMLERGYGRIINMASQLGQIGGETMAHYAASKAGLIGFTKSLAREVSQHGVLVNAIAPGPIETAMLAAETEEWTRAKLASLPIHRFGAVEEVVPTAIFLASDDARYYVGQTLGPNGGDVML